MAEKTIQDLADDIIQSHVMFSFVPGFAPVYVLDIIGIAAIQVDMVKQLCKTYGQDYNANKGKALVTALSSSVIGRIPGYAFRSAFKVIPGIGWLLGGLSMATFSGASTYATGMVFKRHFENGGKLGNLKPEDFQKFYEEQYEKGKELVQKLVKGESKEEQKEKDKDEDSV